MQDVAVAKRYAKALEELTNGSGDVSDVLQALSNLTLAHCGTNRSSHAC